MRILTLIKTLAYGPASSVVALHVRAMVVCKARGWWRLCHLLSHRLQRRHGVFLPPRADFHADITMPHPTGIVIGEAVQLGRNVTIFQGVTLGSARIGDAAKGLQPRVGDGCTIFAGAVVLGDIRIGDHAIIGANAVVTCDVPDNCTAVGAPARIPRMSSGHAAGGRLDPPRL